MPAQLGARSLERLSTCDPDLQLLVRWTEAHMPFDITVLCGHRPPEEQFELFKQGRALVGGKWVVMDQAAVVTNVDGFETVGRHNEDPSSAVDMAPHPVSWASRDHWRFHVMAGVMLAGSVELGIPITWGADWDGDGDIHDHSLVDLPHFQLKR